MRKENITSGHTEGPSHNKHLMSAIAALALLALVLTVCICAVSNDDVSAETFYDDTDYELDMTTSGSVLTIKATNLPSNANVTLDAIPDKTTLPWDDSGLYEQITDIEIVGFSGGTASLFSGYVNLEIMRGWVYWTTPGSSTSVGTQVGTWEYDCQTKSLTVSALSAFEGTSMPDYYGRTQYIPWSNVPTVLNDDQEVIVSLAGTESVTIEGFTNCGWQAFKDITVTGKTSLQIEGEIYTNVGTATKLGYWQFTKSDGVLLIVYDPNGGARLTSLGTMPTWSVDTTTGTDTRPWSHGAVSGGQPDWDWYSSVQVVKNRGFDEYSVGSYTGMESALITSVGNIYTSPDDTGTQTGEWSYIHSAPSGYRFGITANSLMLETSEKLTTYDESRLSLPAWTPAGNTSAPWHRLSYSWESGVENIYILNYNGSSEYGFLYISNPHVYTTGYVDDENHTSYIGEWIYDHGLNDTEKLFTVKAYTVDTEMPNWSALSLDDQRPWGRYSWASEVTTIKVSMFSNISDNAFVGFTNATTKIIVGEIVDALGVSNGEWQYNDRLLSLTLAGLTGATMKDYSETDSAPWSGTNIANITEVTITGYVNVGTYAFFGFAALKTIIMEDVTTFNKTDTFFDVSDTVENITANAVVTMPDSMFSGYSELKTFSSASLTTVGKEAFKACPNLMTFSGPSVTTINQRGFQNCTSLSSVTTNEAVSISDNAFDSCTSLVSFNSSEEKVYLPLVVTLANGAFKASGVKDVFIGNIESFGTGEKKWGDYVFQNCTSLERFTSDSVENGRKSMFTGCTNLKYFTATAMTTTENLSFSGFVNLEEVTLTECSYIIAKCFYGCTALITVHLPTTSSVVAKNCRLAGEAFRNCTALTTINLELCYFNSNDDSVFYGCTALTADSVNTLTTKCGAIEDYTFYGCTGIEGAIVLKNTGSIASYAFCGCTGITSADFSENKANGKYLYHRAFKECTALESVKLPQQYTYIDTEAFYGCTSLKHVEVPGSAIDLENQAAQDEYDRKVAAGLIDPTDESLKPVRKNTLPDNCTTAGYYSFEYTIIENMYFPDNTTVVYYSAFRYCSELNTVDLNNVVYVYNYAFDNCTKLSVVTFGTKLLELMDHHAFSNTALTTITVNCAVIGSNAFENCTALTYASIKKSTTVGSYSFNGCAALATVEAGKVEVFGSYSFYGCKLLTYVDLTSATKINDHAFYSCELLKFTPEGEQTPDVLTNVTTIGTAAFAYCYALELVNAPVCTSIGDSAFYATKITSVNLPSAESLYNNCFFRCTDLTYVNLNKVSLISYRSFYQCSALARLVLSHEEGITTLTIGQEAFYACTNLIGEDYELDAEGDPTNITPIYFGNVVGFGQSAFHSCYRLTEATANSASTLGHYVFYYCKELKSASINAATSMGQQCFEGCVKLKTSSATSMESVPYGTYSGCTALETVTMTKITTVGQYAFNGCTNLNTVGSIANTADLTYTVTVGYQSFYNTAIEDFKFGTVLTSVGTHAFRYTHDESFVFPDSLTTLGQQIFSGAYTREVVYPSSITSMEYYQFYYCQLRDTSKSVDIYFNAPLQNMGISKSTPLFHFSTSVQIQVNFHMTSDSDKSKITTSGSSYKRTDYFSPVATYMIETGISSGNGSTTPDYTQLTAIDGSQIVLPYCTDYENDLYEGQYFGVSGSTTSEDWLGVTVAGTEGKTSTFAVSGQCIHTYVQANDETILLMGDIDSTKFSEKIQIGNHAELPDGVTLKPTSASYAYGQSVVIPTISVNTYTISTVNGIYGDAENPSYSYSLPTKGTFNLGCYFTSIEVSIADHTITNTFVDGEETFTREYIFGQTYAQGGGLPGGTPPSGYKFVGWFTLADGKGEQIKDTMTVKKQYTLYAYYTPMEYTVHLYSNSPSYSTDKTVSGVYTLYREDGQLLYTDATHTTKTVLYDPTAELPGYKISRYWVDGTREIKEGDSKGPNSGDMNIEVSWTAVTYSITLNFVNESLGGQELDNVILTDLLHGHEDDIYDSGDTVSGIKYSELSSGYVISIPKHSSATFSKAYAIYREGKTVTEVEIEQDQSRDCQMILKLSHFIDNAESLEIQFKFLSGYYRTQFVYNDDTNRVLDSTTLISDETASITMPVTPYSKSGYTFKYWSIGDGNEYAAESEVSVTSQLLSYAEYGMLIFEAVWEHKQYTVHYDMGEYTEGQKADDVVEFGVGYTPTTVSGYLGHTLVSWAWVKEDGSEPSSYMSAGSEITVTKEVVDTYAYGDTGLELKMLAIWDLREYTVTTTESASPRFSDIKVRYTESFTLWDGTTARVPEGKSDCEFGAWVVDSQSYSNKATVTLNDTLAYIGDMNEGTLTFVISWVQTEYMVRYDFCDGTDPTGELPTGQMGPYCIGDSFEPVNGSALQKDGYTYDGWKLLETDFTPYSFTSGKFDAAMATYADSDNVVTLYANWEQIKFKITYELEGGTRGEYAPTTATYGTEILISNPTKSGYTFLGWTATNLSTQTVVKVGDNWQRWDGTYAITYTQYKNLCTTANGTVTFTANWTTLEYELKYQPNCDNYTLGEKTEKVKVGEKIILPTISGNVKTGYGWKGWGFDEYNTIESGIEFTASMTSYAVNGTITIYGVWEPIKYTISYTYYPEYGERTVNAQYGDAVKIPTIDRIGYTFLGWTSSDIDTSTSYYSNDQLIWYKWDGSTANGSYFKNLTAATSDGKVTMTGVWKENIYKIVYTSNATSAKDPVDENEYKIGSSVTLVKTIEGSNNGKTFLGWTLKQGSTDIATFTEFTTTVASYADVTNSVHLYGVWSEGTYTVTVDLQGCTASAVPAGWTLTSSGVYTKQFDYNTKMDVVMDEWSKITLTKDGYKFSSWDYSNASVVADTLVTAKFTEVQQDMVYIFIGVIAAALVAVLIFTRIER